MSRIQDGFPGGSFRRFSLLFTNFSKFFTKFFNFFQTEEVPGNPLKPSVSAPVSDNIPFEIQVEIIKRLPVKSLIQFRSVSKTWKSLIDSSYFVADYTRQHTQTHHILVRYQDYQADYEQKYVSFVDDATFPGNRVSLTCPVLLKECEDHNIIGWSHGLFCFYCPYQGDAGNPTFGTYSAVIWNPSIRKEVDVVVPNVAHGDIYESVFGFGVCRETSDPKIVKITHILSWADIESANAIPCQVEVFTLSTGDWRSLSSNLPSKLICFHFFPGCECCSIDIDGVLYWFVTERNTMDGGSRSLIISFDITSEEFGEVNLPNGLSHPQDGHELYLSKLRESLVMLEKVEEANRIVYSVWMVEGGVPKSFTKLFGFNVNTPDNAITLGFRMSGEPIIEMLEHDRGGRLVVYEPHLEHMDDLGFEFDEMMSTFFVHPYMETLLLLDQPNLTIHNELETLNIQR